MTEAFSTFHTSLKSAISLAEMQHPLTAITFSDSVFIATNYLFQATTFAVNLARSMLSTEDTRTHGNRFWVIRRA